MEWPDRVEICPRHADNLGLLDEADVEHAVENKNCYTLLTLSFATLHIVAYR